MPNFTIVNNTQEIERRCAAWSDAQKFASRNRIVDGQGCPSVNNGRQRYLLIAKKTHTFPYLTRIARCFLGILAVLCSVGLALRFNAVRSLFKGQVHIRFGIPLPAYTPFTAAEQALLRGAVVRLLANGNFAMQRLEQFTPEEQQELTQAMADIAARWQLPSVQRLIQYIGTQRALGTQGALDTQESQRRERGAIECLLVVLGIKPCRIQMGLAIDNIHLLQAIAREIPNIVFTPRFLVNESPLAPFDPRKYLRNCGDRLVNTLANQNVSSLEDAVSNQILAYLLAFGPSWETYYHHTHRDPRRQPPPYTGCYTALHSLQLGRVLRTALQGELANKSDEELGSEYHRNFTNYRQVLPAGFGLEDLFQPAENLLSRTGSGYIYDFIAMRTSYLQMNLFLRAHILERLAAR